jgi:Skp family chaperone for outer membrane proteins
MKKILSILLVCFAVVSASAAELRIAVVDLDRVFREYYKSRIAEDFLNQQAEAARLYLGQLTNKLEAQKAGYLRLRQSIGNQAVSDAERQKMIAAAGELEAQIKATENEIAVYQRQMSRELQRLEQTKRGEILLDIQREIRRRAAAENYAFVLDCSGKSANGLPAVLVCPAKNDISNAVIRELNRSAAKPAMERK